MGLKGLKSSQKFGFTLAEVLITLAIIGVVAALTIPVVVNKYQKQAQYTAFMKMYNTLSNALALSVAENGQPNTWNRFNYDHEKVFDTYLKPYLKIAKKCNMDENSDCGINNDIDSGNMTMIRNLNGNLRDYRDTFSFNTYMLQDGSIIQFSEGGEIFDVIIDTNGAKGPNAWGRDIFNLSYFTPERGDGTFGPYRLAGGSNSELSAHATFEDIKSYCSADTGEHGTCGERLLLEGKMNY